MRLINRVAVGCAVAFLVTFCLAHIRGSIPVWHRPQLWIDIRDQSVSLFNARVSNTYPIASVRLGVIVEVIAITYLITWASFVAKQHQAKRKQWRAARSADRCPACGYDLRATPDRCPECGHGGV